MHGSKILVYPSCVFKKSSQMSIVSVLHSWNDTCEDPNFLTMTRQQRVRWTTWFKQKKRKVGHLNTYTFNHIMINSD